MVFADLATVCYLKAVYLTTQGLTAIARKDNSVDILSEIWNATTFVSKAGQKKIKKLKSLKLAKVLGIEQCL